MSAKKTYDTFLSEAKQVHGDKFTYDESTYVDTHTKMRIICPKHGEFWQTPKSHLKYDCEKCSYEKRATIFRKTTEQFINDAKEVHGDKYDYSKVEYIKAKSKVIIICPKHGEFLQMPNGHLSGQGCPKCNISHLEKKVLQFLKNNNISYIYQYKNKKLKKQSLDFYLPEYNIGIECQGKQHFGFGGWDDKEYLKEIAILDKKKFNICKELNIKMIYVIPNNINPEDTELYNQNFIKIKDLEKLLK